MRSSLFFLSITLFLSAISLSLNANEYDDCCEGRFAVQAAMATGGNLGIGIGHYSEQTEFGVTISGQINNARHSTKTVTPVIFGGLRNSLCEGTYLAYGLNFSNTFGTDRGRHIKYDIEAGPYFSLEQMLTSRLMLVLWINPYLYEYQKIGHQSVTTQSFFHAGGIGLNYFF